MEDEFATFRTALSQCAQENKRLNMLRVEKTREYEKKIAGIPKTKAESDAVFTARLLVVEAEFQEAVTAIENRIRVESDKEHAARQGLAKAVRQRAEALASLEDAAYANRRAPIGEGIRLTEKDFQKAQKSVPLVAHVFFLAAFVVVVFAVTSSNSSPTPTAVTEFVIALLVAIGFGIRADRFVRRADRRAEERLQREAEGTRLAADQAPPSAKDIP